MNVIWRDPGCVDYARSFAAMQSFAATRSADAADEFWTLEHPPVLTLGRAGRREHILAAGDIPVVETDRGGQVTYHGPGQLVVYTLLDARRLGLGPRELVRRLEQGIMAYLARFAIRGVRRAGAPGVYVGDAKIAALGLRMRQRSTYHGIALNVAMDLAPFLRINPCGYAGLQVTQLADHGGPGTLAAVAPELLDDLYTTLYPGRPVTATRYPSLAMLPPQPARVV